MKRTKHTYTVTLYEPGYSDPGQVVAIAVPLGKAISTWFTARRRYLEAPDDHPSYADIALANFRDVIGCEISAAEEDVAFGASFDRSSLDAPITAISITQSVGNFLRSHLDQ